MSILLDPSLEEKMSKLAAVLTASAKFQDILFCANGSLPLHHPEYITKTEAQNILLYLRNLIVDGKNVLTLRNNGFYSVTPAGKKFFGKLLNKTEFFPIDDQDNFTFFQEFFRQFNMHQKTA